MRQFRCLYASSNILKQPMKMLDAGKRKALIDWVNALSLAECIESLQQLKDGIHFCNIVQLIDKDQIIELETPEERFNLVITVLEGHFQVVMLGKIDTALILSQADEFELAKTSLLLLCVGVLSENSSLFLQPAMKLDMNIQLDIREMAESVLKPVQDNRPVELESSFSRILMKQCAPVMALSQPQMSSTPQTQVFDTSNNSLLVTPTQSNMPLTVAKVEIGQQLHGHGGDRLGFPQGIGFQETPVFSNSIQACSSILGRFCSPQISSQSSTCMSPVQQLVCSPGMSSKIKMQQKEQRIKRLMRELNAERYARSELEVEIQERDREIEKKDLSISEIQQQLQLVKRQLMSMTEKGESVKLAQDMEEITDIRMRNAELVKELREQKERNAYLEAENTRLCVENNKLQEQVGKLAAFRLEIGQDKNTLSELENLVSEQNVALRDKARMVCTLTEANKALEQDLRRTQELYKQQQAEWHRAMEISVQNESGECLQEVMEKQLTEQIELLQGSLVTEQGLKDQLNEQIGLLKSSLDAEKQHRTEWKQQAEALNNQLTATKAEFESQKSEWMQASASLNNEIHNLKELADRKYREMNDKISVLSDDLVSAREENVNVEKCLEMQMHEKNTLHQQCADLQGQLLDVKKQAEMQLSKLHHNVSDLKQENTVLVSDIAREQVVKSEQVASLRNELNSVIQTATVQEDSLKNELRQVQCSNQETIECLEANYQLKINGVQCELKKLEESLKCDLQAVQKEKSRLEVVLSQEESERTEWQSRCTDLQQELDAVRKSSQTQISEFALQLKTAQERDSQLESNVNNAEVKIMEVEDILRNSKDSNEQKIRELTGQVAAAEEKVGNLEEALTEYSSKYLSLSAVQEQYCEKVATMEEALKQKQEETIRQNLDHEVQLENEGQKIAFIEEEKVKLREELKVLKSKVQKLSSELSLVEDTLLEKEKIACSLQITLDETHCQVTQQKDMFGAELEVSRQREEDLQGQLTQAEAGLAEFRGNLQQLQHSLEENARDLSAAKKHGDELTHQLRLSENRCQQLESEFSQSQLQVSTLQEAMENSNKRVNDEQCRAEKNQECLKTKLFEMTNKQQSLNEANARLQQDIMTESTKLQDTETELKFLKQNLEEVKQSSNIEQNQLQSEFLSLQMVRQQLQVQVEVAMNTMSQLERRVEQASVREDELKQQVAEGKDHVITLESTVRELEINAKATLERLSVGSEQLMKKTTELQELKAQLQVATDASSGKIQELENQLNTEQQVAQLRISVMQDEHSAQQKKCHEAETKLKYMEQSLEETKQASHMQQGDLQNELVSLQTEKRELLAQVEIAANDTNQIRSQLELSLTKERDLQQNIVDAQQNTAHLEKLLEEKRITENQIYNELRQEITNLNEQLISAQDTHSDIEAQIKAKAEQVGSMELMAQELEKQLSVEQQQASSSLAQLDQEYSTLQCRCHEAETRLRFLEQSMEENKQSSNCKQDDLKNAVLSLQTAKQQLQAQLEIESNTTSRLRAQLEQAHSQEKEFAEQMADANEKLLIVEQHLQDAKSENRHVQEKCLQENMSLKESVIRSDSKIQELTAQLQVEQQNAGTKIGAITQEQTNLQSRLGESATQVDELNTQCSNVTAELSSAKEIQAHLEAEVNNKTQLVTYMENEIEVMRDQLASKSRELCTSLEMTKALQLQMQNIDVQSHSFERAMKLAKETSELAKEEFKAQLLLLENEKETLLKENEAEKKNEANLKQQLAASSEKIQQLESQLQDLRLKMLLAEGQKQEHKSHWYEKEKVLQQQNGELCDTNIQLKLQMDNFKSRVLAFETHMRNAENKLSNLMTEHSSALQRIDSLVKELANEKDSHGRTRNHLQEELQTARKSRQEAESKLAHAESMHKQTLAHLDQQASSARKQKESFQGKIYEAEYHQQSQLREHSETMRSMQVQLDQANTAHGDMIAEITSLRSQLEQAVQANQSQAEGLEKTYRNQQMQMESAYKQLRDKCESLKDERLNLKCKLERLEDEFHQAGQRLTEQHQRQLHSTEQHIDQLNHKILRQKEEYSEELERRTEHIRTKLQDEASLWQQKYEQVTASYHKMKEMKRQAESDSLRSKDAAESYRTRCESKSQQLRGLEQEIESYRDKLHLFERQYKEADVEVTALKAQLHQEDVTHRKMVAEIRTIQVQLDLANRQLRGKDELRKTVSASTVPQRGGRETTFDVKDTCDNDVPLELNDLCNIRSPPSRTKRQTSRMPRSPSMPARLDESRLTRDKRAASTFSLASSNGSVIVDTDPHDTLANHTQRTSSTSLSQSTRATRSRSSAIGLPGFISQSSLPLPSHVKDHHLQANVPRNYRGMIDMNEDEPEQLEFGRLSELQRRNTLCLPHLKSTYPVETQVHKPEEMADDDLRVGQMIKHEVTQERRLRRKRPSSEELPLDDILDSCKRRTRSQDLNDSLEASAGKRKVYSDSDTEQPLGSYQRPGPPTPGVTPSAGKVTPRRLRSRNTPSPVVSTKKKWQSSRKFTPLRRKTSSNENYDAQGKVPKDSFAFNIGFTPKKSRRLLGKKSEESQKKKPLSNNNRVGI